MEILRGLRPARFAAFITLAAAFGMMLALSDQAQRLDWAVDDRFVRVAAREPAPPDNVVIVAIDEPSFSELQRPWPWPRRMHGALVEALARGGARTIVFDVVFDTPAADPEDDRLFVEAVQRAGNVILAADVSETTDQRYAVVQWAEPFDALARAAEGTGAVKLPFDPDGVLRRGGLTVEGRAGLAFAAARLVPGASASASESAAPRLIGFRGAPRGLRRGRGSASGRFPTIRLSKQSGCCRLTSSAARPYSSAARCRPRWRAIRRTTSPRRSA
jgi:CHASE2 domain-containing sensor protein